MKFAESESRMPRLFLLHQLLSWIIHAKCLLVFDITRTSPSYFWNSELRQVELFLYEELARKMFLLGRGGRPSSKVINFAKNIEYTLVWLSTESAASASFTCWTPIELSGTAISCIPANASLKIVFVKSAISGWRWEEKSDCN